MLSAMTERIAALSSIRTLFPALALALLGCGANEPEACTGAACDAAPSCAAEDWSCAPDTGITVGALGGHYALAAGSDGSLALALYDAAAKALVVGRGLPGSPLRYVKVDGGDGEDRGRHNDVAVASDNTLQVVYSSSAGSLYWARVVGLEVQDIQVIESSTGLLLSPALVLDAADNPHVAYFDSATRSLRYASRDSASGWQVEAVPHWSCHTPAGCNTTVDYGRYSSLGLQAGQPVLAYYDRLGGNLALARRSPVWEGQVVDGYDPIAGVDTGDVGRWPSLRVSASGALAIAYHDAGRGALRYLSSPQGQFVVEVIDDGRRIDPTTGATWEGIVGAYAQLTTSREGYPAVYYFDSTAVAVRRSVRTANGWGPPVDLSGAGPTGLWLDVARLPNGTVAACAEGWQLDSGGSAPSVQRELMWWLE
jgi:hypothetical protein